MSLFDRLEQRTNLLRDPALIEWFGGGPLSGAGVKVTAMTAMGIMAVWAAVRLIAETLAGLPLGLYRKTEKGREQYTSHPNYPVLHDRANDWQTAFEWREMMQAHVLLRGNAYSLIAPTNGGYVDQLVPLHPDRVTPRYESITPGGPKVRYYHYQPAEGSPIVYWPDEIFHVRGLSDDGFVGLSPLTVAREALGLAIAAADHGSRFLANNVQPGGVFEHPGRLKDDAFKRLSADLEGKKAGTAHAGKSLILEEGMKWHQLGMTNKDAQFLETRKFSVTEIARMFKVPPHMIADLERATFSNVEHLAIEFVVHTMMPWVNRWEQRINHTLLGPTERKTIFAKFTVQGLLRGDVTARGDFYTKMFNLGAFSPNDILEHEDMNPVEGGNRRFVPLNMIPLDQAGEMPDPEPDPVDDEDERAKILRQRIEVAHVRFFLDAAQRILAKEINAAQRAITSARKQQSVAPLDKWLEDAYDADHEALVTRTLLPAIQATAESIAALGSRTSTTGQYADFAAAVAMQSARRYVSKQRAEARECLVGTYEERATALETLIKGWERRAVEVAGGEVSAVSAAVTKLLPAITQAA